MGACVAFELVMTTQVRDWLHALRGGDPVTRRLVAQAIDQLLDEGPGLGRPLVDRITGSSLHNLKELRPGSSGSSEVRILFDFDPSRNALLLVAGDKSGQWKQCGGRGDTGAASGSLDRTWNGLLSRRSGYREGIRTPRLLRTFWSPADRPNRRIMRRRA